MTTAGLSEEIKLCDQVIAAYTKAGCQYDGRILTIARALRSRLTSPEAAEGEPPPQAVPDEIEVPSEEYLHDNICDLLIDERPGLLERTNAVVDFFRPYIKSRPEMPSEAQVIDALVAAKSDSLTMLAQSVMALLNGGK